MEKEDWPPSDWLGSYLTIFSSDLACTWSKMIDHPSDQLGSYLKFFISDLACTWWRMIDPPIWLTRISPKIFKFRFSVYKVKVDWPPSDWPECHLKFFISDLACISWKSIDPPSDWPWYHLKFLSSYLAWTCRKRIDPPSDWLGYHLKYSVQI